MKTMVIAHRGASKYAPENTMPAFQLAYELGAEGIETDVQLTKDGVPILIHDEDLKRTTNGSGLVNDYTLKELKRLDAGSFFSQKYAGTPILSLDEFLNWASDKPLYLNLELKNNKIDYKYIEAIVLDAIRKFQVKERTTISSFNPDSVTRMRQLDRNLDVALLRSRKHLDLINYAKNLGASSLHAKYTLLNHSLVNDSKEANLPIRVFTVNREINLLKCFRQQFAGIMTDVPDIALRIRDTL